MIAMPNPPLAHGYRPDIDGLRAIAVIAVIFAHFNDLILPSGYLGVDVFFVISGYVITASFASKPTDNPAIFFFSFYSRRIKRLMPALLIYVSIVFLVFAFLSQPTSSVEHIAGHRTAIASLFGVSNLYIFKQATNYFGSSAAINPFMHTWSLGVEEQFYLIFPAIVWFTGFSSAKSSAWKSLLFIILFLTTASLFLFLYLYSQNQPAAYFLMPSRFWEIGLGCIAFLSIPLIRLTDVSKKYLYSVSIISIIVIFFFPASFAPYSCLAIVILSFTALVVHQKTSLFSRFLTHPRLVYIGLISYSLYLWHWGVISLSRWTIGIHWWTLPFQVSLIFFLSILSYHFVETPIRALSSQNVYQIVALGFASSIVLLSSAGRLFFLQSHLTVPHLTHANANCQNKFLPVALFIGDSHAYHYGQSLPTINCDYLGFRIKTLAVGGTIYPPVYFTNRHQGRTRDFDKQANHSFVLLVNDANLPSSNEGFVVISIRPSLYFYTTLGTSKYDSASHYDPSSGQPLTKNEALDLWIFRLEHFIKEHPYSNFILFTPTADYEFLFPDILCTPKPYRPFIAPECQSSTPRLEQLKRHKYFVDRLIKLRYNYSNVFVFDAFSALCPDSVLSCTTHLKGSRLYTDESHLSSVGAQAVLMQLSKFVRLNNL
jgi:peptidoglycan/LPS O-acetylase OafA/YrhL